MTIATGKFAVAAHAFVLINQDYEERRETKEQSRLTVPGLCIRYNGSVITASFLLGEK